MAIAQVPLTIRVEFAPGILQSAVFADTGDDVLQGTTLAIVHMYIATGDHWQVPAFCHRQHAPCMGSVGLVVQ